MNSHSSPAALLSPLPSLHTAHPDQPSAVVVLLDGEGRVEVVDLLTHPDGARLLREITRPRPGGGPGAGGAGTVVRLLGGQTPRSIPDPAPTASHGPATRDPRAEAVEVQLSDREREVLELIVSGCSNQEIAERLFLGINTIKSYVRTSYRKIHVTKRSQAVRWGFLNGVGQGTEPCHSERSG